MSRSARRQYCGACFALFAADADRCPHCGSPTEAMSARDYREKLLHALEHPLADVRMRAILALGLRADASAAEALLACAFRLPTDVVQNLEIVRSLSAASRQSGDTAPLRRLAEAHPAHAVREAARRAWRTSVSLPTLRGENIMGLLRVPAGKNLPHEFNVVIEIPMHGEPIKYEVDKQSGTVFVDRFMSTAMHYPCNYGYIPDTLSSDGDPVDVLVIAPSALPAGVVIACRPIGLLRMEDENGKDEKILAVPLPKLTTMYAKVSAPEHLPEGLLQQISHFFAHYKDLEPGKFSRIGGFEGVAAAEEEILRSEAAYRAAHPEA